MTGMGHERRHDLAQLRGGILDQRDQSGDRPGAAGASALDQLIDAGRHQARGTRTISASPWPPPPHNEAAPTPPPRRLSSCARCSTSRAPDIPIGCPTGIAPPLTLTRSGSRPSSRVLAMPTAANA